MGAPEEIYPIIGKDTGAPDRVINVKKPVLKEEIHLNIGGGMGAPVIESYVAAGQDSASEVSNYALLAVFVAISGIAGYYYGNRGSKDNYNILGDENRIELVNYDTI